MTEPKGTPTIPNPHHTERVNGKFVKVDPAVGLSRERVRQIEREALWKIKRTLAERGIHKEDLID